MASPGQPTLYKPKYREASIQLGSTELDIHPDSDYQRFDGYWVAPQPVRLLNYEPHMHATGMRMCIEAIYQNGFGGGPFFLKFDSNPQEKVPVTGANFSNAANVQSFQII